MLQSTLIKAPHHFCKYIVTEKINMLYFGNLQAIYSMPVKYFLFITLQMCHNRETTSKTTVPSGQPPVRQIWQGWKQRNLTNSRFKLPRAKPCRHTRGGIPLDQAQYSMIFGLVNRLYRCVYTVFLVPLQIQTKLSICLESLYLCLVSVPQLSHFHTENNFSLFFFF